MKGPKTEGLTDSLGTRAFANPESRITNYSCNGFTLLELLVVLVILAVVAGAVMLRLGGGEERVLQREAERLAALVQVGCERAERVGRDLGVRVDAEGYRFSWLTPQGLAPIHGGAGETLRPRRWERPLQVRSLRDGRQLGGDGTSPQFGCSAHGELTAFRVELQAEEGSVAWVVEGGPGRPSQASRSGE